VLPKATAELPGVGGTFRLGPEDFEVEEVPAYLPSGEGEHLYLWVEKRMRSTPEVARSLAGALGVSERDVSYAGLKDRRAVSRQWFSVWTKAAPPPDLYGDGFRVIRAARHGNKLRTGHLLGNRFRLVLRGTHGAPEAADAILAALALRGVPNWFGPQRFGRDGDNAVLGLALVGLAEHREVERARRDRFLRRLALSALQSALFNALLEERLIAGGFGHVERGDLLQLGQDGRGPVFACTDPEVDQPRFLRFEVSPTGPLFGPKMRWPEEEPGRREQELMRRAGLTLEVLALGGGELQGGRRPLRVRPTDCEVEVIPEGLRVGFILPRGAYATALLLELMKAPSGDREELPEELVE
jgi:tRNA pseudouridine13 synthase